MRRNRALLIDRARHLERMNLAVEVQPGIWTVYPRAEGVLRELGERGDIIKTMHRALEREGVADERHPSCNVLHREKISEPIVGRVLSKGLGGNEMGERVHLVVDGVDGRVHHIELDASRAEEIGRGMIVKAGSAPVQPRAADRNVAEVAGEQGVYRPSEHLKRARAGIDRIGGDPEAFVRSHVRRLEALRRAGHVERMDEDHWRVPQDLPERGLSYDLARADIRVSILSPIGLDKQNGHDGATWLDRELVSPHRTPLARQGFGADVAAAMERRKYALVDMGYATELGSGRIRAPKDLIQQLERGAIERVGKALAVERGRQWQPATPGNHVTGRLVGSTQLASGRFAMIDDGTGFSLVPWSDPLEKRLGQHLSGVAMPGGIRLELRTQAGTRIMNGRAYYEARFPRLLRTADIPSEFRDRQ